MKCLVVLALCLVAHSEITEEENVLVLTGENFKDAVKSHQHILVEFYAPWCGHCKSLAPEYAEAATTLKEEGSEIKLAKADATLDEFKDISAEHGVQGFPTLKFFTAGAARDYSGGRTASEIVAWLKKKTGDPFIVVTTVQEVSDEVAKSSSVILGAFKDRKTEVGVSFINTAADIDDTVFIITDDEKVMEKYELVDGGIAAIRDFVGEPPVVLMDAKDGMTVDAIKEFVQKHQMPLVIEFSDQTAPKIFGGDIKNHYLLFADKTQAGHEELMGMFREATKLYTGELAHVFINTDVEDNERILEFFGLTKDDGTSARIIDLDGDMKKYAPDPDFTKFATFTAEDIATFAQKYLAGELKVHLMSEEIPEDWDTNPVKVLVGKNFEKVAFDETKDVLVEFYAPWCGHCKQLAPIYDELAAKFENNPHVVVAKMDATANEVEGIAVQSFPTIKFFPKNSGRKMVNCKDRTLEELTAFLNGPHDHLEEDDGLGDDEEDDFGEEEPFEDDEFDGEEFDDDYDDEDDEDIDLSDEEMERDEL